MADSFGGGEIQRDTTRTDNPLAHYLTALRGFFHDASVRSLRNGLSYASASPPFSLSYTHTYTAGSQARTTAQASSVSEYSAIIVGEYRHRFGKEFDRTMDDLSMKKCVPCDTKELRPMTGEAAKILIQQVPGWNLLNEGGFQKLHRSWKVKTFVKGMEFLRLVADISEAEGHHPDLHLVEWNNIKIDIWTHAVGGLTENDFILAAKINGLNLHHLLRITPTND
ncbi:pterin-4-alpha-carbinolamine dehydratase 2, mitochondrial-like [Andrographis paniculata]|uniref:pterin-4-alpha-carbinolamine dehydratase 2, mitochondrial-like n=1 Tax=Andrographis paniculata TaxID=175694 RepID=UPI0021E81837|nr:pterin-4-alpha-carbinolamine dehydratase 2, mitochondrial-like [Andrographis paniculata]